MITAHARQRHRGQDGFTLVELLVVILLLSIVGTILMSLTVSSFRAAARQEDSVRTLNQAKVAMERMTRDIREANSLTYAANDRVALVTTEAGVRRAVDFTVVRTATSQEIVRTTTSTDLASKVTSTATEKIVGGLALGKSESVFGYLRGDGTRVKDPKVDGTFVLVDSDLKATASIRLTVKVARGFGHAPIQLDQVISIRNLEG